MSDHFGIPRGLPGVNAAENDAAVINYIEVAPRDDVMERTVRAIYHVGALVFIAPMFLVVILAPDPWDTILRSAWAAFACWHLFMLARLPCRKNKRRSAASSD